MLRERQTSVGDTRIQAVQDEWAELIPAMQRAMDGAVDPASPDVVALARRWKALVDEFTGGDSGIGKAVMTMYEHEGAALKEKLGNVPTPAMFAYVGRAMKHL